ncbi:MAG: orotidine-5-phosphate decarboxylase [Thermoleophilaceae bacterium]|nr:orotidine-5-phosphate decarboxylase [Thermoleophilaceae bacterium]
MLGLDPDPAALWPAAVGSESAIHGSGPMPGAPPDLPRPEAPDADEPPLPPGSPPDEARALTAAAVARHCRLAIEAAGSACVAVKFQLACFERLGGPGWDALEDAIAVAREHGLLTIADGKRGDVPVSASAYAQALVGHVDGPFGPILGLDVDAFTANPLLGRDALEPLVDGAVAAGAGVFSLVRTSNPGGADLQDRDLGGAPLHETLAGFVADLGAPTVGASGLAAVGAVTGATRPDLLARLRALMPSAIFLLPGVGAQGGSVTDLAPAFSAHRAGGLVTASRSIVSAWRSGGGDPAQSARAAAEELRGAAWSLVA